MVAHPTRVLWLPNLNKGPLDEPAPAQEDQIILKGMMRLYKRRSMPRSRRGCGPIEHHTLERGLAKKTASLRWAHAGPKMYS